jgi:undecaprenyl-diphosphatase
VRERPRLHTAPLAAVAVTLTLFLLLTAVVWGSPPSSFDEQTIVTLSHLRTPIGARLFRVLTGLGGGREVAALTLAAVIGLLWVRRRAALFLALTVAGSALLNGIAKWVVERPRPSIVPPVYHAKGLSFPSGHSMASFALFVGLWLVAREERSPHARAIGVLALVVVPLVGFTRMYLGVHYPTDVIAGWALATAWVIVVHAWYVRHPPWAPPRER